MLCAQDDDRLYEHSRYFDGLRSLRADHPERLIFSLIAGVPPELVTEEALADVDFEDDQARDAFYEGVLDHRLMQLTLDDVSVVTAEGESVSVAEGLRSSCVTEVASAVPPRRLVKVAQQFGAQAVIGSICAPDFGETTGTLIRTIGERLIDASESPDAG